MTPAVGYRFWRVDPDDAWTRGRLQSPVAETLWPPLETLDAECQTRPGLRLARAGLHRADELRISPEPGCSCGIYAYHDIGPMTRALREEPYMFGGAVLCWGRIVIHPEGLRAQYARPLALCRPESPGVLQRTGPLLEHVTREYAIPLLELKDLVAYASEFGGSYKPDPSEPQPGTIDRVRKA
ncbi:MAG TPA: hypothetical protein VHW91_07385, partial [Candidatus Dormibacteraeota bacterium]|nr:hypothetical protein [Candidatus Dormibacteraeota bacterium]